MTISVSMAGGRPNKTPQHSAKTKVSCRICGPGKPQIVRQHYREHLKVAHEDTSGNLREWGQGTLTQFSSKMPAEPEPQPLEAHEMDDVEEKAKDHKEERAEDLSNNLNRYL